MPDDGDPPLAELLTIATEAVDRASKMLRERAPGAVTMKGDRDPATEVDYAIERELRAFLLAKAPGVGFLGEEDGRFGDPNGGTHWALDPVDGTMNFMHGIPLCAVSLGLVRHGSPTLGVIDLPYLGLRYSAVTGAGAYRDGITLRASNARELSEAVVALGDYAVGSRANEKNADRFRVTQRLASSVARIRMLGSAAIDLAWVAEGRIEASVMLANKPWDSAAGALIASEAGAVVSDVHGVPYGLNSRSVVCAAPGVASALLSAIEPDVTLE